MQLFRENTAKMTKVRTILILAITTFLWLDGDAQFSGKNANQWQAGVATNKITPDYSMWLAGYGARTEPSDGTLHDLWAKALAIQDSSGRRAVLITTDLVGVPKQISDAIRGRIQQSHSLEKADIILNTSHTHTGPVLTDALTDIYPLTSEDHEKIDRYSRELVGKIVKVVDEAFKNLRPAKLYADNGVARFQVNRRNNQEASLIQQSELSGPNDHAVPVLKITRPAGKLMAIVFGYACHPTVLSSNQWSGDYPGFAQIELEKEHRGAVAMFFQGAGADQNPMPRRTVPLARQYGRTLAAAVDRVLEEEMKELSPQIATAYTEIDLKLNPAPTAEELTSHCEMSEGYQLRWGKRMLDKVENGEDFPEEYPFPVQIWQLGDQSIFALGGETVVGYALRLKEIFGYDVFVMGYSNDVMAYIPTATILHEGGYEGATSQIVYGMASTWSFSIESDIMEGIMQLSGELNVPIPGNNLIGK